VEFYDITDDVKVSPGEYLLHEPSSAIVLCGAFRPSEDKIRVLGSAGMFEDIIKNFKKIKVDRKSPRDRPLGRCKGCARGRM
jgi:hypothetical protein